jgi:hypothetical protein
MITVLTITALLIAGWIAMGEQQYRQFQRYAKPGDPIRFYIGEEKYIGKILAIDEDGYTVDCDELPELRYVTYRDAYPVFRYKYES